LYLKGNSYSTAAHAIDNLKDTVGAGDAYAAMLALGVLKKWTPEKILKTASWFASRICEIKGAIPSSAQFYRKMHLPN
jgi:fructokinase